MYQKTYKIDTVNIPPRMIPYPIAKNVKPTDESVPAAPAYAPFATRALPQSSDDLTRLLTLQVYEDMLTDPAVASSFGSLKLGILSGGMQLVSPIKQPAWSKHEASVLSSDPDEDVEVEVDAQDSPERDKGLTPEQKKAKEILEFCQRATSRILGEVRSTTFSFLDALAFGVALCEPICTVAEMGKDKGKLVWKSMKTKPIRRWNFVVDSYNNVIGILSGNSSQGWAIYPPDKFAWLSWMPKDGDPRGTSQLRAAHLAWNHKTLVWPEYYAHTRRFGSGGLDFEMAEGDENIPKRPLKSDGTIDYEAAPVDAAVFYSRVLAGFANGGILTRPANTKFTIWEPKNNGEAFIKAFDLFDRQICLAIQYQVRTTLEAKNGSRADSQTAQDTRSLVIDYGRDELAIPFLKMYRELVRLNFGEEDAEAFTPIPTFGGSEGQDKADKWLAAASIGFTIAPSQLMQMDDELGLPIRDPMDAASAKIMAGKSDPTQNPSPKPEPGRTRPTPTQNVTPKGANS